MAQVKTKKVYDFNIPKVKNQLVKALKKRRNESTVADLISTTGLPKFQVEQTIKVVSDEYQGHLKVTESGELLYYFPRGMVNHVHGFVPGLKRFFSGFLAVMGKILALLFKIWIMVMLIGYFALFIAILIAAVAASIALSVAGNKGRSSRSSKGGGFFLVIKLFELFMRIWFYNKILQGPQVGKKGRALHKAIFAFVFGEPDMSEELADEEKKYIVNFIQSHKGVITLDEFMALTGKDSGEANLLINRYLLEFEGEPLVTDNGSIFYFFPELLKTAQSPMAHVAASLNNPVRRELVPFNYNDKKKNIGIGIINGFNIAFGSYFLYFAAAAPFLTWSGSRIVIDFAFVYRFLNFFLTGLVDNPPALILISLGIVPLAFSFFFYLIPLLRNMKLSRQNEEIRKENLRKKIYNYIHANPMSVDPDGIHAQSPDETPKKAEEFKEKVMKTFAAEKQANVDEKSSGKFIYMISEFDRQIRDVELYRNGIDLKKYAVGKTVFDSGE